MLHMVVLTHGPDTCAAAHPEPGEMARTGFGQMDAEAKKLDVSVQGAWVDAPGHVFYLLADAPNAHALRDLMVELRLFHWNTIQIHPITTVDEALPLAAR